MMSIGLPRDHIDGSLTSILVMRSSESLANFPLPSTSASVAITPTPPPLVKPQTLPETEEKVVLEPQGPKEKKRSYGWVYVLFVIIVCSSIAVFTFQQIRINELETELTEQTDSLKDIRRVSDSRQTEIDEMKQEELMRQKEEKRISLTKQIAELNTQLDAEKAKLDKINEFQLFRSSEDKVQQVTAQQDVVNSLEQKIEALKKEQQENE